MPRAAEQDGSLVLGVDVGGTKIETVLIDAVGTIVHRTRRLTSATPDPESVVSGIAAALTDNRREASRVAAIGVAVAGQVDESGVVLGAPNLGWRDVPLQRKLEAKLDLPAVVLNDVRAAAWAEWQYGAGRGSDDLVVLFVGTGVGGGIVSGGRMLGGIGNVAGELGHTTLVAGGRACHCRNRGCLEAYIGGWAIAERARELVAAAPESAKLLLTLAGSVAGITAGTVAEGHRQRDALASRIVAETGEFLGAALVSFVNGLNPARVLLGGGVIAGLPGLIEQSAAIARARALPAAVEGLEVLSAVLVTDAPAIGAAGLARRRTA